MEASTYSPDIVLLDLGLPDREGIQLILNIRSWSNLPIIVISARSEDRGKIEASSARADGSPVIAPSAPTASLTGSLVTIVR